LPLFQKENNENSRKRKRCIMSRFTLIVALGILFVSVLLVGAWIEGMRTALPLEFSSNVPKVSGMATPPPGVEYIRVPETWPVFARNVANSPNSEIVGKLESGKYYVVVRATIEGWLAISSFKGEVWVYSREVEYLPAR
jgi:hypothetical protein